MSRHDRYPQPALSRRNGGRAHRTNKIARFAQSARHLHRAFGGAEYYRNDLALGIARVAPERVEPVFEQADILPQLLAELRLGGDKLNARLRGRAARGRKGGGVDKTPRAVAKELV